MNEGRVPSPPFPNHERCLYRDPATNLRCYRQAMNDEMWCSEPHRFDPNEGGCDERSV